MRVIVLPEVRELEPVVAIYLTPEQADSLADVLGIHVDRAERHADALEVRPLVVECADDVECRIADALFMERTGKLSQELLRTLLPAMFHAGIGPLT